MVNQDFSEKVWQKGRELYRTMPWREDTRPYYVLVSELMLQQTQVDRVIPKFNAFTMRFPDVQTLAEASLADVLTLWSGLGYNRRAKFLHAAANKVVTDFGSEFPRTRAELQQLPGVGEGTSGAIMAYAFNATELFIETNVRTVYFHHFFGGRDDVRDAEVLAVLADTIDRESPREFYWALMDYGAWLKKQGAGRIRQSASYKKQSPLKGSVREVRGQIIRTLTQSDVTVGKLRQVLRADDRFEKALGGLVQDGLVTVANQRVYLTK
jgi:A/G-specific adenine glycosylase